MVAERYVPRGRLDVEPLLSAIAATRADAVLLTLVGSDLVEFNRAFADSALAQRVLRLCPALEENGLLGVGGDATGELYATMGYFASIATDAGLDFVGRYAARFGPLAPVPGGHGEGCYDGMWLLAALASRAGSLATPALDAMCDGTVVERRPGPGRDERPAPAGAGIPRPGRGARPRCGRGLLTLPPATFSDSRIGATVRLRRSPRAVHHPVTATGYSGGPPGLSRPR